MLSNNIIINASDGGAIINVTIAVPQKRSIKVNDWLKVLTQMSGLPLVLGKLRTTCDKGPRPIMYAPALPPLMSAECDRANARGWSPPCCINVWTDNIDTFPYMRMLQWSYIW